MLIMAKSMVRYKCSNCGAISVTEMGRCKVCGQFGTMEPIEDNTTPRAGMKIKSGGVDSISTTRVWTVSDLNHTSDDKTSTGVSELDRLLDGGLIPGQVVLIGAEPGFGKSTLCLKVLGEMADRGVTALYASGEESAPQIADRARRIGCVSDNLKIVSTTTVEEVLTHAERLHAGIVCVDSLQAMASDSVDGGIGGISQSKEASFAFKTWAKDHGVPFLIVSQFTKSDDVAGSNQIPHVVDTILIGDSDYDTPLKFLRSRKNRYGRTGVTGVFVHDEHGLESVRDPSKYLLGSMDGNLSGSARSIISDGGRLLPVEIDALVAPEAYGNPQRRFDGMNSQRAITRVARLMVSSPALDLDKSDVFVGSANGIKINDSMADLAMMAAIASSSLRQPPKGNTMWLGEVSLTGQIRGRSMIAERVAEAVRLGFNRVVCSEDAATLIPDKVSRSIDVDKISMVDDVAHKI
jgi:DNA repair protein RadA/Sms